MPILTKIVELPSNSKMQLVLISILKNNALTQKRSSRFIRRWSDFFDLQPKLKPSLYDMWTTTLQSNNWLYSQTIDFILSVFNEACDFHITEGLSLTMTYQLTGAVACLWSIQRYLDSCHLQTKKRSLINEEQTNLRNYICHFQLHKFNLAAEKKSPLCQTLNPVS